MRAKLRFLIIMLFLFMTILFGSFPKAEVIASQNKSLRKNSSPATVKSTAPVSESKNNDLRVPIPVTHRIYSFLYDNSKHPDRLRYHVTPPTWRTFDDKTQFICLRSFPDDPKQAAESFDRYQANDLGRVIWPVWGTIFYKNLGEIAEIAQKKNLYLFDFWGYVPGCGPYIPGKPAEWIQFRVNPTQCEILKQKLGERWLGMDNGEQDGRYVGSYSNQIFPIVADRLQAGFQFQRHFEQLGDDLNNRLAILVSLNFGHYYLKEGINTLIGAETAQALPNAQVYYSWIRGAGKQYGVHWFGNASIFNRWGWKVYSNSDKAGQFGPTKGTSLNLLKRLMYCQILYNSVAVGFENGWFIGEKLGPIGKIQQSANRWLQKNGMPGTMITPTAILTDFHSGWSFPRHLYSGYSYRVWGTIPYESGDYLTNNIMDLFYPGYQDSSYFHDERGFLTPTPYADSADNLLSDAPLWLLNRYPLLIAAGNLQGRLETKDKLTDYVRQGGRLIITAGNIVQFGDLAGISVGTEQTIIPGSKVSFSDHSEITETFPSRFHELKLPENAQILAKWKTTPLAAQISFGKGTVIILASDWGISSKRAVSDAIVNKVEVPLANPYPLPDHVRKILDRELSQTVLFSVGKGLGAIVCRKAKGVYTVGIFNNGLKELPFKIESKIGKIVSLRELPIDTAERSAIGFLPEGFEKTNVGKHSETVVAGADVRIFEVRVEEEGTAEMAPSEPIPNPKDRFLSVHNAISLKEWILIRPTFFQHYDGVVLNWKYLLDRTKDSVEKEARWLKRQKVRLIVDFTSGLNLFPDLRLTKNDMPEYEKSMRLIREVIDKASLCGAEAIIVRGHKSPETSYSSTKALQDLRESFAEIARYSKGKNIRTIVRAGLFYPRNIAEVRQIYDIADKESIQFAIPLRTATEYLDSVKPEDPVGLVAFLLLGGSIKDPNNGGFWTENAPLYQGEKNEKSFEIIRKYKNIPHIFDSFYKDQNEEYQDLMFLRDHVNTK